MLLFLICCVMYPLVVSICMTSVQGDLQIRILEMYVAMIISNYM